MENEKQNPEKTTPELAKEALHMMVVEGKSILEVKEFFIKNGVDEFGASYLASFVASKALSNATGSYNPNIVYGWIWLLGGLIVTIGSYIIFEGHFVFAYGAILYGAFRLAVGYRQEEN